MKKVLLVLVTAVCLTGCNRQLVDLNYKFDRAQIAMPDGSYIEGKVDSWTDFEDGDQLQVTIDGITYLTSSNNVVLISK